MRLDFTQLTTLELAIMAAAGLFILLCGYRIKKVAFFVIWFVIGMNLTNQILPWLTSLAPDVLGTDLWQMLLPIAGGLLLAMLGFTIEKICVAGICFALVMLITTQYFGTEVQTLAIGAVVGVIVAGAAVALMKPAIIIMTALAGAYALAAVVFAWFGELNPETLYFPVLVGLTAAGSIFQLSTTRSLD